MRPMHCGTSSSVLCFLLTAQISQQRHFHAAHSRDLTSDLKNLRIGLPRSASVRLRAWNTVQKLQAFVSRCSAGDAAGMTKA